MKALMLTVLVVLLSVPALAELRTENAIIVKAVTNAMFPVARYELTAQIPCYAVDAKIFTRGAGQVYDMGVAYTWDYRPGHYYCRAFQLKNFKTAIASEILPTVNIINAAPGVGWERAR